MKKINKKNNGGASVGSGLKKKEAMSDTIPLYRLRDMIISKYTENKFSLGYSNVARWLSFELKRPYYPGFVQQVCNAKETDDLTITIEEIGALKKLFGFKTYQDFFSFPEQMPDTFKKQ